MPAMQIRIPDGYTTLDGSIECRPDDQGNYLYIETDHGEFGEPLPHDKGKVAGARIRIEMVNV